MTTRTPLPGGRTDVELGDAPVRLVVGQAGAEALVVIARDPTSQDVVITVSGQPVALSA